MGTPLTPAQRTEWYDYFKDMDAARRTRFADLMAAAPVDAAESAYTLNDLQILDDVDDVQESVADVAGMRKADVRYFMQYWRAHGDAADVSNKPVAVARAMVVATAAVARGDAPGRPWWRKRSPTASSRRPRTPTMLRVSQFFAMLCCA
jgi:hypothetical protein